MAIHPNLHMNYSNCDKVETRDDGVEYDENNINVHADCFECTICGAKLLDTEKSENNETTHMIMDGRFYCEMHGIQRQKILTDNKNSISASPNVNSIIRLKNETELVKKPSALADIKNTVRSTRGKAWTETELYATMVMADANIPFCNAASLNQTAVGKSDKLPRKYKDFTKNEPISSDHKAKSIQKTLQNSKFIQELKRNLVDRAYKIDENNGPIREIAGKEAAPLNNPQEKPPRKLTNLNKLDQTNHVSRKVIPNAEDFYSRLNFGTKANNLINEFIRDQLSGKCGTTLTCESCHETILGAHVLANGKVYCHDHFTCANAVCNRSLLNCGFLECEKGRNYCKNCYDALVAPICQRCRLPISADCLNALQKNWHPDCFVCTHCRKPFEGNLSFYVENNLPYCETDWNELFTNKCAKCARPIKTGERFIEALGASFHSQCFQCEYCKLCLECETFYARNGKPYCYLHRK